MMSVKEVCFSARTSQIPYVKQIVSVLETKGMHSFFQENISLTGANWQAQWLMAADIATKIVCIITVDYPDSKPCCEVGL